ncbi:NKAP domain containing 1 [Heptranchias perlo]|uniref:NKAP domain containing 1 n=1 Tax=Heptranchias perlo TaxID=212740 RepID=UPI003559468E
MARIPMGKVLLRNVIRHTDAHNKIQEESEMWKIREKEKQTNEMQFFQQRRKSSVSLPGNRMRCDGYDEEEEDRKANAAARKAMTTPQDERETRYWTKKLYEFEANDPNRWGHSGYKELYPEEFESDSDQKDSSDGHTVNGAKTIHLKSLKSNSRKRKRSSKSNKKKRKKKSSKKMRKKRLRSSDSSSDSESSAEEDSDHRKRRKAKKKHRKKTAKKQKKLSSTSCEGDSSHSSNSDTSSKDESDSRTHLEKRRKKRKKQHHRNVPKEDGDKEIRNSRKKRKNWKIAHNDTSDDSGEDDLN